MAFACCLNTDWRSSCSLYVAAVVAHVPMIDALAVVTGARVDEIVEVSLDEPVDGLLDEPVDG